MAIRRYKCNKCGKTSKHLDQSDKICNYCESTDLKKLLPIPLDARVTDQADSYRNSNYLKDVQSDAKRRTMRHNNDTIDDFIEEFGEAEAISSGRLIWDDKLKKYRKRNDWDTDTTNAKNRGSK